ncbi:MAG: tetratricopeptide repeat protein [Proteobacteria bacterium]|nr:MAG: tetratricopeptide repeat protein [Pseudomonadota bacterium]
MKMRKSLVLSLALVSVLAATSGCSIRTRAEIAREKQEKEMQNSLQQNVLESSKQMEALQSEIGRLQGKLEEMDHNRQKDNSSAREGTEKQVSELRIRLEEQQKAQNASQQALFEEIKRLREENIQLADSMAKKAASAPAAPSGASKKGAKGAYDSGLAAYKAKDYDGALEGMRGYLEGMPNGKFALSARYYVGDSLYAKKDFTNAIVEFGAVQEKSPSSSWGRKAALRIAESFNALGKKKDAKTFAQMLVDSAPDSPEAKRAKKFLN